MVLIVDNIRKNGPICYRISAVHGHYIWRNNQLCSSFFVNLLGPSFFVNLLGPSFFVTSSCGVICYAGSTCI
jgi:hypothetical protein